MILTHLERIPAVSVQESPIRACEVLRENPQYQLLPVIGREHRPIGVIKEQDLRKILYSRYGHALLENPTLKSLESFVISCPVFELSTSCETLLSAFAVQEDIPGILFTQEGNYVGFLGSVFYFVSHPGDNKTS